MMRVKPGDPENSFLMRKIDGCFEGLRGCMVQSGAISTNPCGDRMPRSAGARLKRFARTSAT